MAASTEKRISPKANSVAMVIPQIVPDVATAPHPTAQGLAETPVAGPGLLQEILPEINALAQKVGGFKRLAEIAAELDRGNAAV
jgi:hypothetical protein